MDTKANQRLPLWWILILAPLGYAGTNLFHWLASPEIQELTGIGQYRIFSLLVYTLATGIAVIVYMVLLKNRGMTMKAAGYRSRLTWKGAIVAVIAVVIVSFIIYPLIEMGLRATGVPMYWTTGQIAPVNQNTMQDMLLGIFVTVILAPLTEDTIFRGYVGISGSCPKNEQMGSDCRVFTDIRITAYPVLRSWNGNLDSVFRNGISMALQQV